MVLCISHNALRHSYLRLFMLKTGQKKRQKGVFSKDLQAHDPRMIILQVLADPVEDDEGAAGELVAALQGFHVPPGDIRGGAEGFEGVGELDRDGEGVVVE